MLAVKYIIFAIVATLFNLLVQYLTFYLISGKFSIFIAIFIGTLASLLVKFVLDKKFIFYHKDNNKKAQLKTFLLYACMGIITTAISAVIEYSFYIFWVTTISMYIGAVLGQIIGYTTKYQLDKKYVFKK